MVNSVYFGNCVNAIRKITYGRDNRKPIADACIYIYEKEKKTNVVDVEIESTPTTDCYRLCFDLKT